MRANKKHRGFSVIEALLGMAVVGLIAFVSYTAFQHNNITTLVDSSVTGTANVGVPATISDKTDLVKAENALDAVDTSSSTDLTNLDAEVSDW